MTDAILQLVEGAVGSPWFYAAILGLAAVDAFFPAVPSETLVITAGVFAAAGDPNLALVVVAAAAGAFAGDHVSYLGGRVAGRRLPRRVRRGRRRDATFDWARDALARRGGAILVVCRYIPGARTAVTLTAGGVGYPLRSFSLFDAVAAGSWALYSALVGYLGGVAFEDDPLKGLGLGLGLALALAALVELARHVRGRRARRQPDVVPLPLPVEAQVEAPRRAA